MITSAGERDTPQTTGQGPGVHAKWERMWQRRDNQEVGLEAAIFEGKRNSSLVERGRAENKTGLKHGTEAAGRVPSCGRGSTVGERCSAGEAAPEGAVEALRELMPI